jgi:hypothetical protein
MKPHKSTLLIVLFGLLLTVCAVALAQTSSQSANQGAEKKQGEASCCTDSCCCKGDSCPMKTEGARTTNATDVKDGCCCCAGDSCEMKMSDSMKNHADHSGCCCGDSCDMKAKEKMENHSSTDGCCCDMKNKHHQQNMKAKQKTA